MKKPLGCVLLLIIATTIVSPLWAQEPALIHFGVAEGLPSNLVYSTTQDKNGFIWFATDKGLARYDGIRFQVYGMEEGLPDKEIFKVKPDRYGRLWMSPFQQNPCYWDKGKIYSAANLPMLQGINFAGSGIDFQETPDGKLWLFGTTKMAYYVENDKAVKRQFLDCPRMMFPTDEGLFCFSNNSIGKINLDGEDELLLNFNQEIGLDNLHSHFEGIAQSGNKVLYSRSGMLILVGYYDKQFRILDINQNMFGSIIAEKNDCFWVCNNRGGAYLVDCSSGKINLQKSILEGKKVNYMMIDRQNTRWFCTLDEGVYGLPMHTPSSFTESKHLASGNILSLEYSKKNGLVAGDDEGNLYVFDDIGLKKYQPFSQRDYNRVLKILAPENDTIYVTTDSGIYCFRDEDLDVPVIKAKEISAPKSIHFQNNKIWAVSSSFIGYFLDGYQQFVAKKNLRFTSICSDLQGHIWGGGVDGLYSDYDEFNENWGQKFPELSSRIVALSTGEKGYIWVVTALNDLLKVQVSDAQVKKVDIMNRFLANPIRNIKALQIDGAGNIWLGTNNGVYMLRPNLTQIHYDKHDGLADNDVNTLLARHNQLWVGTTDGLTVMQLGLNDLDDSFSTYCTAITYQLENKKIQHSFEKDDYRRNREVAIPPLGSLVHIELAGLDYLSRGNVIFEAACEELWPSVKWITFDNLLHGIFKKPQKDTSWVMGGAMQLGIRLNPGKYRYQFAAVNTRDRKSDNPDEIILVQLPHWYETLWFWLAFWTVVLAIGRKFYRDRMAYRNLMNSESKLRLQALQAQMNPHFIGNSIYAIQQFFYPPDPEKASEYIELFNRLLRQSMLMSEKHFVFFMEDLRYYLDYLTMLKLRFGERFSYEIEGQENLESNMPFPAMILQPIIENATIHGLAPKGVSKLKISFLNTNGVISCAIEDNGEGIDAVLEQKRRKNIQRESKGLEILFQRITTLNQLYNLDIQLNIVDLKQLDPQMHGTRAILSFHKDKFYNQPLITENRHEEN